MGDLWAGGWTFFAGAVPGAVLGLVLGFVAARANKSLDRRWEQRQKRKAEHPRIELTWQGAGVFHVTNTGEKVAIRPVVNLAFDRDLVPPTETNPLGLGPFDPNRASISSMQFQGSFDLAPGDSYDVHITHRTPGQRFSASCWERIPWWRRPLFKRERVTVYWAAVPWPPEHEYRWPANEIGT